MECIICSEEITAATGRTVLGCGHEFHMMCVAQWFCQQEGVSSCPCCRRESGVYDDLPRAAAEEDDESDDVSGWSDEDDDDDDDDESLVAVEIYWLRDEAGVWKQVFRETATTRDWNPVSEPDTVPEEIDHGATALQRLWRGYLVRRQQKVAGAVEGLLALKDAAAISAELDPMSVE